MKSYRGQNQYSTFTLNLEDTFVQSNVQFQVTVDQTEAFMSKCLNTQFHKDLNLMWPATGSQQEMTTCTRSYAEYSVMLVRVSKWSMCS